MVIRLVKVTGNKKPLSNSTTEVAKSKGAVLLPILVKYDPLSNIVSAKRRLNLASTRHLHLQNNYKAKLQYLFAIKDSNHGRA
jgi:hypothetical protein